MKWHIFFGPSEGKAKKKLFLKKNYRAKRESLPKNGGEMFDIYGSRERSSGDFFGNLSSFLSNCRDFFRTVEISLKLSRFLSNCRYFFQTVEISFKLSSLQKVSKIKNWLPQRVVNSWNLDKNLNILAKILGKKSL